MSSVAAALGSLGAPHLGRLASERRLKPEYFDWEELQHHIVSTLTLTVGAGVGRKR